jgi:hypothetical protein
MISAQKGCKVHIASGKMQQEAAYYGLGPCFGLELSVVMQQEAANWYQCQHEVYVCVLAAFSGFRFRHTSISANLAI